VELYDQDTDERLEGKDTRTTVVILDDDKPGIFGFSIKTMKISGTSGTIKIKIIRQDGSDGVVPIQFKTSNPDFSQYAIAGEDYIAKEGEIIFEHNETEKIIEIEIIDKQVEERDDVFCVQLL